MIDRLTEAGAGALFDTGSPGVVLWHRAGRGEAWRPVSRHDTERDAWRAIETSGKRNGDWIVLEAGREP
jgi:hypothetical protein